MSVPFLSTTLSPKGFHFTLSTTVHIPSYDPYNQCPLHLVHALDPHVYADQYELAQHPEYTSQLWGTSDLEKPVSAVDLSGSVLLLTTRSHQLTEGRVANITFDVPLHARYGRPVENASIPYYNIELKRPIGFFSCAIDSIVPVPGVLLPYASLPGWPSSTLVIVQDIDREAPLQVSIPVGAFEDLRWVDIGTALVMITTFFYLFTVSIRTARRLSTRSPAKTD